MTITAKKVLINVRTLLSDERRWIRGLFAKDAAHHPVIADDESAVCWCLEGALYKACPYGVQDSPLYDTWQKAHSVLQRVIGVVGLVAFNDSPKTTHAMVLEALDKAIESVDSLQ